MSHITFYDVSFANNIKRSYRVAEMVETHQGNKPIESVIVGDYVRPNPIFPFMLVMSISEPYEIED